MHKKDTRDYTTWLVFFISMAAGVPFTFLAIHVFDSVTGKSFEELFQGILLVLLLFSLLIGILLALCTLLTDDGGRKRK